MARGHVTVGRLPHGSETGESVVTIPRWLMPISILPCRPSRRYEHRRLTVNKLRAKTPLRQAAAVENRSENQRQRYHYPIHHASALDASEFVPLPRSP